jgi:hypothetical protein
MMWGMIALNVSCFMYNRGLRDMIKKLVDDPNEKWDELMLELLDSLLGKSKVVW